MRMPWELTSDMFLAEDELESLLRHVNAPARLNTAAGRLDRLIIEILAFTGLRTSEFCALRVADSPLITREHALMVRGKRGGGRTVWIPTRLADRIAEYVNTERPAFLPANIAPLEPDLPLVLNERGRAYERSGLYRRVVGILSASGLAERASVQLLRHTYGVMAYRRSGGNLLFVQRQLGHAHPMITSIYAQFVPESYGAIADRVGEKALQTARAVTPDKEIIP